MNCSLAEVIGPSMMNGSSGLQNKHALKSMIMRCSTSNRALAVKVKFMKSKSILPKKENVREYPGPGYSRTFSFQTGNGPGDKNETCENIPALDILARFRFKQVMSRATLLLIGCSAALIKNVGRTRAGASCMRINMRIQAPFKVQCLVSSAHTWWRQSLSSSSAMLQQLCGLPPFRLGERRGYRC